MDIPHSITSAGSGATEQPLAIFHLHVLSAYGIAHHIRTLRYWFLVIDLMVWIPQDALIFLSITD
jgi:hypothetical protein